MSTFSEISKQCYMLVDKLDWQTYHTPENLASILVSEVGELSEICVWLTKEQVEKNRNIKLSISEEFADVVKAAIYFYNSLHLNVSLETLISKKLDQEESKYQVKKYLGKSKYEELSIDQAKSLKKPGLPIRNIKETLSIKQLEERAWSNAKLRNWDNFYTPATLCLAIFEDCSKIYTSFQRRTIIIEQAYPKVVWAVAGILILCLRFGKFLDLGEIDILVRKKMKKDFERFKNK